MVHPAHSRIRDRGSGGEARPELSEDRRRKEEGAGSGASDARPREVTRLLLHAPASTAVTMLRKELDERMQSFSTSTTRKNTKPATISHGQTQSGMASLSKSRCSGGA